MQQDDLLNVGLDLHTGQAVTVGEGTYEHWRAKGHSGDHSLVCLYCHQTGHTVPLVISGRVGGRKRRHFKHPPGTAYGGHSPETVWHADGKLLIARWARRRPQIAAAELEWCTPDNRRRADVLLTMADGARMAVELQSRLLTDGTWTDRHRDYERQNIIDLWLWHPARPAAVDPARTRHAAVVPRRHPAVHRYPDRTSTSTTGRLVPRARSHGVRPAPPALHQ